MKILILTNHSYMLFQFRRELIEKLLENNKIVIGTPFGDHIADFRAMGCRMLDIPIDRRGINPKTDLELYKQYKRVIKEEKPDKVITYSIKPNIYAGFACRIEKIPYYVNVQGLGTAFQKKGLATVVTMMYKVALKKAQRVFFENEANAQEFINRRILKEDKIVVLHGAGVNLEKFVYQPYPREDDGIHFLYLGRIMKEKGMDELFQAAKNLKAKYGDKIVFDIVGFFEDEYKATVEQLEKDGIIVFHGFQADPRPFYAMAHCVVLPSYHEGMSNVLLEAAATGRAVITSDIPGCREAIEDDKNGFLVEVKSSDKLEKAMEKFLSCSMDERRNMGLYGRAYCIPALLSFWGRKKIWESNNSVINLCANMSVITAGFYLISMETSGILLGRLPIYFSLYSYILLPWEIEHLFAKRNKQILYAALICCYLLYYFYQMHFQNGLI